MPYHPFPSVLRSSPRLRLERANNRLLLRVSGTLGQTQVLLIFRDALSHEDHVGGFGRIRDWVSRGRVYRSLRGRSVGVGAF